MKKLCYLLLIFMITACSSHDDFEVDTVAFDIKYFFDITHPESCHYIMSMAKSNDGSILFSGFTFGAQNPDLYRFENEKIEKIDPNAYFAGCQTYQYGDIILYEKGNLLVKYDPDEINGYAWLVTDMNDRGHSEKCQKDAQGNIWVASRYSGTYNNYRRGILMFDGSEWRQFVPEWQVFSLCLDKYGNVYANTLPTSNTADKDFGVILKYDGKEWKQIAMAGYYPVEVINSKTGKPEGFEIYSFPSAWFSCLQIDYNNHLWAGTLQRGAIGIESGCGLDKMDLTGKLLDRYAIAASNNIPFTSTFHIPSNSIVEVKADNMNNVWIGMYYGGMAKLSPGGKWQTVTFPEISTEQIPASVEHILFDGDKVYGSQWIMLGLFELQQKRY